MKRDDNTSIHPGDSMRLLGSTPGALPGVFLEGA